MAQGIWQETDHRPVTAAEASREWTLRAYEVLAEVAGRYGRSIEYADLASEVQRRSGIMTDMPWSLWLDAVLTEVGHRCQEAGHPSLVALVHDGPAASKLQSDARLACYQAYGAKMPAGRVRGSAGGRSPGRTSHGGRSRSSGGTLRPEPAPKRTRPPQRERPVCPTCFLELPATGVCDSCD